MTRPLSAGILVYRRTADEGGPGDNLMVLLAHPGGPFWARKDDHAWSIPKGEVAPGEDPLAAARREFHEELGRPCPEGPYRLLGQVRQSRKTITAWAVEADFDTEGVPAGPVSTVELEWPPRSGRRIVVPEVDRVEWCTPERARQRLHRGQDELVDRLVDLLEGRSPPATRP